MAFSASATRGAWGHGSSSDSLKSRHWVATTPYFRQIQAAWKPKTCNQFALMCLNFLSVIANVSVTTTDKWMDKTIGQIKEATGWHLISLNGRLAEIVGLNLKKGSQFCIEGSLRTCKWTDKDGLKNLRLKIRVDQVRIQGSRKSNDGPASQDYGSDVRGYQPCAVAPHCARHLPCRKRPADSTIWMTTFRFERLTASIQSRLMRAFLRLNAINLGSAYAGITLAKGRNSSLTLTDGGLTSLKARETALDAMGRLEIASNHPNGFKYINNTIYKALA